MTISFIIPLYNCKDYIKTCLDSILDQDIPPKLFEIIIVDDGSTDGGHQIIEDLYLPLHKNIKLIRQANKGVAAARNTGLKEAAGCYIWFFDADDRIVPCCLGYLLEILNKEMPDVLRIGATNVSSTNTAYDISSTNLSYRVTHSLDIESLVFFSGKPTIWNTVTVHILKSKRIKELHLEFNESLATLEDQVFMMSFLFQSDKAIISYANIYRRLIRSNSVTKNKDISHLKRYNCGRINASIAAMLLNEEFQEKRSSLCYKLMHSFCNDTAMHGLMHLIKYGCEWNLISHNIKRLKQHGLYPFKDYSYFELHGFQWTLVRYLANSQVLLKILSATYRFIMYAIK